MLEHRFAKVCAVATFVLLVIGGTVNPTGSSLACPEPTIMCHGQLFPPMVGGVFYEHGHRLAAMTVGLLQIGLTIVLIRRRKDLTKFAWITAGLVTAQAALGAVTVAYKLPWFISTAHLLLGMSYFATLVYVAFRTRPEPTLVEIRAHHARRLALGPARKWIAIAAGMVLIQLLLGALVRHLGAALVCLGMPTCTRSGSWWPEAGVQQLHMIHRGFGVLVAIVTTIAAFQVMRRCRAWPNLRLMMAAAPILVFGQIALGILTVLTVRAVPLAVGHFAGAAGLWCLWSSAWFMTADRKAKAAPAALPRAQAVIAPDRAMAS